MVSQVKLQKTMATQVPKNSNKNRPTLTVMEGREENRHMVDGFASAAKRRGWNFCQLLGINSDKLARFDLDDIPLDHVIFRELSKNNYHEAERLMYWLKQNHKVCINIDVAGRRMSTSDKHFQQGLFLMDPFLKKYALPTFEAKHKDNVISYIEANRVHYPIVLKDRRGTAGKGITLIKAQEDLDKIDNFSELLIEQYIQPECDYRVFVIGGVAVGTMRKIGDEQNPGDFIAWSAGRKKYPENNPQTLELLAEIATRAAAISKLEYAGIDIIKEKDTDNYYLLETNIAAGWPNFTPVTHINIPDLVMDWFEDIENSKEKSFAETITDYIKTRKKYLPMSIQKSYDQILKGQPEADKPFNNIFNKYPRQYLYDAGSIFKRLSKAYRDVSEHPEHANKYTNLIQEIESIPLSWAGNFIGPEVGTMHDGAILSALYLYLLHKI